MAYLHESSAAPARGAIAIPLATAIALQLVIAPQVSILGGGFNFMAAAACALAPGLEPRRAVLLGFLCGILYDVTATVPMGLMTLLLTIGSFALATASGGYALGPTPDGFRLTAVGAFIVEVVYGLGMLLLGESSGIIMALGVHGAVSGLLTAAAAAALLALAPRGEGSRGFSARGAKGQRGRAGTRFKGMR